MRSATCQSMCVLSQPRCLVGWLVDGARSSCQDPAGVSLMPDPAENEERNGWLK